MTELFGTDGIRSEANEPPLTPENITRIGRALGTYWNRKAGEGSCLIGHDGRKSSAMIRSSLGSGLMASGLDVDDIGFCSTPALSFLSNHQECVGGIMVSASHNPYYDNGLKPFQSSGEKFFQEQEEEVEDILQSESFHQAEKSNIGSIYSRESWIADYVQQLQDLDFIFPGHVVIDCANGGTSKIAPTVLQPFCRELSAINKEPNGKNINENSGSLHPDQLIQTVQSKDADIGFAFDGDGDRVIAVDENGTRRNGDVIMYLLANVYSNQNQLPGNGIVITTMSNFGLRIALEENEINYEVVGVGDKEVYKRMKQNNWRIGGEQSGHIIDRNWLPTGDGLRTVLSILKACVDSATPLSDWADQLEILPQTLHNLEVNHKPPLDNLKETQKAIDDIDDELGQRGRIFVRYSGTESVARIMLEGPEENELQKHAERVARVMDEEIHEGEI